MIRVLFQGDSITDWGRKRDIFYDLGDGYPHLVAAEINYLEPNKYEFLNRGISGDRTVDVYARIKRDIINLKPDVMTLLIGVNDVWHDLVRNEGVSAEKTEFVYDLIIKETLEALPNLKLYLIEPYVLNGKYTCNTDENPTLWDIFSSEVKKRQDITKKLAQKYNLEYITLQDKFNEKVKLTNGDTTNWVSDGVHPTAAGIELIKRAVIEKVFNK